jgi:tetratricopeptide (TPR) repeat protein
MENERNELEALASEKMTKILNVSIPLVITSLIGVFFWTIYEYGINIPFSDDYDDILNFLNSFLNAENGGSKIHLIFATYAYHKLVFLRLVTLLHYFLTGNVNLKILMMIGNLGLIGIWIILAYSSRIKSRWLYLSPCAFLWFQVQYWESIYMASGSLSFFWGIFFSLASLFFLARMAKNSFMIAVLLVIMACFTFGTGIIVFPVGVFMLAYQKRKKDLWVWMGAMIVSFIAYFSGYMAPAGFPSIAFFIHNPFKAFIWLFSFIGSSLGHLNMFPYRTSSVVDLLSVALGLAILGFFIYLTQKKYYSKNLIIFSFFIFLFLAALLTLRGRFTTEVPYASRYQVVSILFFILAFMAAMELAKIEKLKRLFPLLLLFAVLFILFSYRNNYPTVVSHKNRLIFEFLEWKVNGVGLTYFGDRGQAYKILLESLDKKTYQPGTTEQLLAELRLDDQDYGGYCRRGTFYYLKGDHRQALIDFSSSLKINPGYLPAYENRIIVHYQLGEYDKVWQDVQTLNERGFSFSPQFLEELRKVSKKNGA